MIIYQGPFNKALVLLKRVSALSLGISCGFVSLLPFFQYSNSALILSSMGLAAATSIFSTSLIHYCVSPYVCQIQITDKDHIQLHTLSLCGNPIHTNVSLSNLKSQDKPFSNWLTRDPSLVQSKNALMHWMPIRNRNRFRVFTQMDGLGPEMMNVVSVIKST